MAIMTNIAPRAFGVQSTTQLGIFSSATSLQLVIRVGLVLAIGIAAVTYVVMVNAVSTQGLRLSELQRKADALQADSITLQLQATQLRSLTSLSDAVQRGGYVPVTDMQYAGGATNTLAQR